MRNSDAFLLSLRAFKTNTSRTLLTILGVSIGIAAVLFLVSLGYGLQNIILDKITSKDTLLSLDVATPDQAILPLGEKEASLISLIDGVDEISPVIRLGGQLVFEGGAADSNFNLVDQPFFRLSGLELIAGRYFEGGSSKEIAISSAASSLLGFDSAEDALGKKFGIDLLLLNEDKDSEEAQYEVVGVFNDDASTIVYMPVYSLGDQSLPPYSGLKVKVTNEENLLVIREELINRGYLVSALSDIIDQTKKIFKIIQIVLGVFGLIALMVSAIGMFNTMTITLLERTQEIGIMRSIGAGTRDVAKLFLFESIVMGIMGGVGGIVLGYLAGFSFNLFINLLSQNFGGGTLNIFYCPTWFLVLIFVFSLITGLITGLYPARRAAKLNPLDALRYK